jgi:hypothetical protein
MYFIRAQWLLIFNLKNRIDGIPKWDIVSSDGDEL